MNYRIAAMFTIRMLLLLAGIHNVVCLHVQHARLPTTPKPPTSLSRRTWMQNAILATATTLATPTIASANDNSNRIHIRLESPNDSLGLQIADTTLRGQSIVVVQRIVSSNRRNAPLQPGMILQDYTSAQQVLERLQQGPYPIDLNFFDLAAAGDAISDMGTPLVTSQDALQLAQQTDGPNNAIPSANNKHMEYSKQVLRQPSPPCGIQSRRGDVLEIEYEASYITKMPDKDSRPSFSSTLYDASSFRGTGQPYQMVLGSGDMIPGLDLGLYDMCPGEERLLSIPPVSSLSYGPRARKQFGIPEDYQGLEWKVRLVTIDGTITESNNRQSRDEREGRAAYY